MYSDSAMRMQREGRMPMELAAAMSEVVLNGAGGFDLRRFFSMETTSACVASLMLSMTAFAADSSLKRAVAWVTPNESSSSAPCGLLLASMTQ